MIQEITKCSCFESEDIKLYATILISLIGLATFFKAIQEYRLQGRQKREELYDKFKERFRTDSRLSNITNLLDYDSIQLKNIPKLDKFYFIGFYEEILISMNSGLIKKNVVSYMMGYYALRCWESDNFWLLSDGTAIKKNSYYWKLFAIFIVKMQKNQNRRIHPNFIQRIFDKLMFRQIYRH